MIKLPVGQLWHHADQDGKMTTDEAIGYDPPRTPEGCECACHRWEPIYCRRCLHRPIFRRKPTP